MNYTPWKEAGHLSDLDLAFGKHLAAMAGAGSQALPLILALLSASLGQGHSCLNLQSLGSTKFTDPAGNPLPGAPLLQRQACLEALQNSPLVGQGQGLEPLVLEGQTRLYLSRYWDYQEALIHQIRQRQGQILPLPPLEIKQLWDRLFPNPKDQDQKKAALLALVKPLLLITGGPGTGKTTTLVKILALWQASQRLQTGLPSSILLVAPTGKAAQRMSQALAQGLAKLEIEEALRLEIPTQAMTLHRALKVDSGSPTGFWHGPEQPLPYDLVVVDEASMVDLPLMSKLLGALRPQAKLILMGDQDQLASVEAGNVLADLCGPVGPQAWSLELTGLLSPWQELAPAGPGGGNPLSDCRVHLSQSHRFAADKGIGGLAQAIRTGQADAAWDWLQTSPELKSHELPPEERPWSGPLLDLLQKHLTRLKQSLDPASALACLQALGVLTPYQQGRYGVQGVNQWAESQGALTSKTRREHLKPVMIRGNHYGLELFNGDVGVFFQAQGQAMEVCFDHAQGIRKLHPALLPPYDPVYAMTIHKSQGSEFQRLVVLLPPRAGGLLSREMLYTAVTRAREEIALFGGREVIRQAINNPVRRDSGLLEALWGKMG